MPPAISYGEMRAKVRDGDIFTFAGNWTMSRLIRWWTGQKVSHIGFAIWLRLHDETRDRLCILESMEPGGIRLLPASLLLPQYWSAGSPVYWQQLCPAVEAPLALGWALEQWGKPYASWTQFISIMWPGFRRFRERIGLPVKVGTGRYHCSELVAHALSVAGFRDNGKDPSLTTPGDVQRFACLSEPREVIWEG